MMVNEAGRIASCCSLQTGLGPPEYRKWRRRHGLQLPLHPQQVAGWVALGGFSLATFLVLVPALAGPVRAPLSAVLGSLVALHLGAHLAAALLDPAEPALRSATVAAVPEFDRSKHAHVIENGRCHLCNVRTTDARTKHCSVCNKCVAGFDHHCKWLNHCVGGRNYVAFLVCVVSAVAGSLVVVAVSIAELVLYHIDPVWLSPWESPHNQTAEPVVLPAHGNVFLAVVAALGALSSVTAGLLLHLCLFHAYISCRGLTTYEYIRSYRQRRATVAPLDSSLPPPAPPCCPPATPAPDPQQQEDPFFKPPNGAASSTGSSNSKRCYQRFTRLFTRNVVTAEVTATETPPRRYVWCSCCVRPAAPRRRDAGRGDGPPPSTIADKVPVTVPTVAPARAAGCSLPALAPPKRRKIQSVLDMKELSEALASVTDLSRPPTRVALPEEVVRITFAQRKAVRKTVAHRDPRLSPIRESGLSNPSSPRLSTLRDGDTIDSAH